MIKVDFLSRLSNFVSTLNSAQESINERILLKPCDKIDLTHLKNAADYASVASNSDSLASIEEMMKIWIRQMEQVRCDVWHMQRGSFECFVRCRFLPKASRFDVRQITLVHAPNSIIGRDE